MNDHRRFRYSQGTVSREFSKALAQRVDAYFDERGISRNANLEMVSKTILGFVLWIATYVWMMTGRLCECMLASASGRAVVQKAHSAEIRPISQCVRPHPGQ